MSRMDEDVGLIALACGEGGASGMSHFHIVPREFQQHAQAIGRVPVVIGDENARSPLDRG